MKHRFLIVVMIVLLVLLVGVFPAAANDKTIVTGKIYWGLIEESERSWASDQYIFHDRNTPIHFQWDTSDPRLNGYALLLNNADWHYTSDWEFLFARIWAHWTIFAEPEYITPLWDCTDQGFVNSDESFSAKGVCNGVGENQGIHFNLVISTSDLSLDYMNLYAEVNK